MSFEDSVDFGGVSVRKFGDVAEGILREKKYYNKGRYGALRRAWQEVVGAEISAATRIIAYEHGKVKVSVDSPVLLHSLKGFMRHSILEELNNTDGGESVKEIFFMAG